MFLWKIKARLVISQTPSQALCINLMLHSLGIWNCSLFTEPGKHLTSVLQLKCYGAGKGRAENRSLQEAVSQHPFLIFLLLKISKTNKEVGFFSKLLIYN